MQKAKLVTSILLVCLMGVALLSGAASAAPVFTDSFEYSGWAAMDALWDSTAVGVPSDTLIQFPTTPTPVDGSKVIFFDGASNMVLAKALSQNYLPSMIQYSLYYNEAEGYCNYLGYFGTKGLSTTGALTRVGGIDATTGRRVLQTRWLPSATFNNRGILRTGWNTITITQKANPAPATTSTVIVYLNGIQIDQNAAYASGGIKTIEMGRNWGGSTAYTYDVVFDNVRLNDVFVYPRMNTVNWGSTVPYEYLGATAPVTWTVENEAGPLANEVGSIDTNGLFTATGPGTCQVRGTDSAATPNTEAISLTIPEPNIAPDGATVNWGATRQFTYYTPSTTWAVENEVGPLANEVGSIDANGLFTATGPGTCQVRANGPSGYTDVVTVTVPAPVITPDGATLTLTQTAQFAFNTFAPPVTWISSDAGVGTIDPASGLFTTVGLGTCTVTATDAQGLTDTCTVTVTAPVLASTLPVVLGSKTGFDFNPYVGPLASWTVLNESGGAGSVGIIDAATGVFNAAGLGTCQVQVTDTATSLTSTGDVTVVSPEAFRYEPDSSTLALYHLDEVGGQTFYDSGVNNLTGTTLAPTLPLSHMEGYFNNAASGFRYSSSTVYSCINVPATAALNTEELTAETWMKTGTNTTGGDVGQVFVSRRGPDSWGFGLGAYGSYSEAGQLTFIWWPLTDASSISSSRFYDGDGINLLPETWYHVAVTFKKETDPSDPSKPYLVKLYCTQAGTTTPVEVASKYTKAPLLQNSGWLRVGGEQDYRRGFSGLIDEVRISSRARTPEELAWNLGGNPNGKVADPVITPGGGTFVLPQQVVISCSDPAATIYYTTDGIDPTTSSNVYNGPIPVEYNMTIRAMAVKDGFIPGYATAKYTFQALNNRPQGILYSNAVNVDGILTDWADAEWIPLDQVYDDLPPTDVTNAEFALRWGDNGNKLYVAVRAKDANPVFTPNYDVWNTRDAVELYIRTTGTGTNPGYYDTFDAAQQYVMGFSNPFSSDLWTCIGGGQALPTGSFTAAGQFTPAPDELNPNQFFYEYEAAITPYHSLVNNQISTLSPGQVIWFDIVLGSHNGSGFGMLAENIIDQKWQDYTMFMPHIVLGQPTSMSIAGAKTSSAGSTVSVPGIVSAVFTDYFYVESPDRNMGIRVNKAKHGRAVGEAVTVSGVLATLGSGERYITTPAVVVTGSGEIKPLAMTNLTLGGGNLGTPPNGQAGVVSGTGVNNIGLLVKATGKVTSKGTGWFGIDDGSGVGIKVYGTLPSMPAVFTPTVAVTGICSCEKDTNGNIQRVILATDTAIVEGGWTPLYEGIDYGTATKTSPRLMKAYVLRIDTQNPNLYFYATAQSGPRETTKQTVPNFLAANGLEAAINANFYSTDDPDYAWVDGALVSNGTTISLDQPYRDAQLRITSGNVATLVSAQGDPVGFHTVVSGDAYHLVGGAALGANDITAPRTSVGLSQDGRYLFWCVVDGRQPGYSDGATILDMSNWMKDFGAWNAINLDGGGSSTICTASGGVLNRPSDGAPRKVGASIGVNSIPLP